ncbi:hypothetical protein FRC10_008732 [Ceratobasidium sp. 414]|nr:hypothetical protein FRC10_008732 [Ceratobasidium sp. 414]
MRFSTSALLALAATPLASAFDLHISTSKDEVTITPNVANEHTPDAGKSMYAKGKVNAAGACTKPRVRKEWRTLSKPEKKAWIDGLKCMASMPHSSTLYKTRIAGGVPLIDPNSTHYDDWTYLHVDSNVKTHITALFFPWHRWYLDAFERAMKTNCGFNGTMPYWNWGMDAADFSKSPIFDADPVYGIGTWGKKENDWHITDGAFNESVRAYPVPHIIRRQWTPQPFGVNLIFPFEYPDKKLFANETATHKNMQHMIDNFRGDSDAFFGAMEGVRAQGVHNAVHLSIGGDMSDPSPTPSDPLFWLHHGMLDRVFAMWQAKHPENSQSFSGGSFQHLETYDQWPTGEPPMVNTKSLLPVSGMEPADVPVEEVMSISGNYTNKWTGFSGGRLCYTYDDMESA